MTLAEGRVGFQFRHDFEWVILSQTSCVEPPLPCAISPLAVSAAGLPRVLSFGPSGSHFDLSLPRAAGLPRF